MAFVNMTFGICAFVHLCVSRYLMGLKQCQESVVEDVGRSLFDDHDADGDAAAKRADELCGKTINTPRTPTSGGDYSRSRLSSSGSSGDDLDPNQSYFDTATACIS